MKQTISQRFFLSLCLMIVGCLWGSAAWAAPDKVFYTLECLYSSSNTAYDKNNDVTINGLTWNAPGNQGADQKNKTNFWRIGGKSLKTAVDRFITGKSPINSTIGKVTLDHKGINRSQVTIHSVSLTVASNVNFSDIIETVTLDDPSVSLSTEGTMEFTPSKKEVWPTGSYYKLTINVSNTSSSGGGLDITSLTFYEGAEAEAPTKTLTSVAVSDTPNKTIYEEGDAFDPTGLVVTGTYSDGSSKEITSGITWNVTPETLTAGVTSVSVTATVDEVTSQAFIVNGITVRALQSVTLEGVPTKTSYYVGEIFDPTGIIVKANYNIGDPEDVTAEATFNYDHSTLTTNTTSMTVTATFGGKTSAEQNYAITVLKNIVPFAPKAIYRKVTSMDAVRDGGVYLIVCEGFDEIMGGLDTNKKRCTSVSATITGLHTYEGEVNVEGKPYEITVSKAENGSYNLYHAGGKYINASSTTTDLVFEDSGNGGWSFSFVESTGNVQIRNTKKDGNYIQRNGTEANNYYKNYGSGQKVVQLYQKVGEISVAKATGGITTFASNYDYIMPENLTGYIVTEAAKTGTITTKAVYHAGEAVPAYTPLIIKSREDYAEEETAKTYNPIALNKGLSYTGDANMLEYTRDENGFTKTTKSENVYYYKLAIKEGTVGFYWGATGGAAFEMTKPSTAYLTVPQSMGVQSFALNLEEDVTTGIATVVTDENAPIYNLQGIRMNSKNLPKGIYIQGGKKFMVK